MAINHAPGGNGPTAAQTPAQALILAASTEAPRTVEVSWVLGHAATEIDRVEDYGLDALAADVGEALRTPTAKGQGLALCPAVFGGTPGGSPEVGIPRRTSLLLRATMVQIDCDGPRKDGREGAGTLEHAVALLRLWGLSAVAWPSPSAVGPALACDHWRALVQIVPDVPEGASDRRVSRAAREGRKVLLRLLREALPGAQIDDGPMGPISLANVYSKGAPRGPEDVFTLAGRALDLPALAAHAVAAGLTLPFDTSSRRRGGGTFALDTLHELATAAGLRSHRARDRTWAVECPQVHLHTRGGDGAPRDTSCAIGPWDEPWRCEHSHGGAGRLLTAELVQLALDRVTDPALRERLDAQVHARSGPGARVEARLAADGAATVEVITAADVPDFLRGVGRALRAPADARHCARRAEEEEEAVARARDALAACRSNGPRRRRALRRLDACIAFARESRALSDSAAARAAVAPLVAVARVTPGAGKSRGVGELIDACAPEPASVSREEAEAPRDPLPVAAVLVEQREHLGDIARALLAPLDGPRRLPMVHRPVSRVLRPDGSPECIYVEAARAIEGAGGSARKILCEGGCARARTCPARPTHVPHDGARDRPDLVAELGPDTPRVVLATHAAGAPAMVRGGVLVIDEAHAAPWASVEFDDDDTAGLSAARKLAGWLADPAEAAVVTAAVQVLAASPSTLRSLPPTERPAYVARQILASATPRAVKRLLSALGPLDADQSEAAAVTRRLSSWASEGGGWAFVPARRCGHVTRRWADGTHGIPEGAGEALRAVRAWLCGALVTPRADTAGEIDGTVITWPSAATAAAAAHVAEGGVVALLDATADARVAAACFPTARVQVFAARLPDRRDAARVVLADTRSTRRSQHTADGFIRWDRIGAQAESVRRQILAWASRHPGVGLDAGGLARQLIARCLDAFWRLDGTVTLPEAAEAACTGLRSKEITPERVHEELAALFSDELSHLRLRALRELVPRWRWTYPGSSLARGSNTLRECTVLVQWGDFRPPPQVSRAVAARTGRTEEEEAERLAATTATQWWGRARVVRDGPPVLLLLVGELPPPDWRGEAVEIVAAGPAPKPAETAAPKPAETAAPKPAETAEARALAALAAAGWGPEALARRLGPQIGAEPASIARTLRRWRAGGEARAGALLEAIVALAAEERPAADSLRARLAWLARGRGLDRVWHGGPQTVGLRALADRAGSAVTRDDLSRWASGQDVRGVEDLLLWDPGTGGHALAAVEAALGVAPPPTVPASASAEDRARAAAQGSVRGSVWERPDLLRLRPGPRRSRGPITRVAAVAAPVVPAAAAAAGAPP